ncbi:hypothetical protein AtDm6_0326 [Acetobacter tropicalis]|uniref:Uncharacterized protein n=1 Tax=Acetobacter tropicalis TaxID=104102 RepID=A0A094YXA6_9PROT|nr:hypothetical protein AtDm6_0326 [Acetobacter tropicalis]
MTEGVALRLSPQERSGKRLLSYGCPALAYGGVVDDLLR